MSLVNTFFGPERISEMLRDCKNIFFIGIGGIHMSSLAHIAHLAGYNVSGSDKVCSSVTKKLEKEGIKIIYKHKYESPANCDIVVYTVAIAPDNPEYVYAREHNIPCVSRADFLGWIMSPYKNRIGISGAHGKSTCTSMLARAFIAANADPTVVSGAETEELGGAYRIGGRESIIFEACEYMDNFLCFVPSASVILNVEYDHSDYFKDIAQTRRSFTSYANLAAGGIAVINADDVNTRIIKPDIKVKTVSFGIDSPADYTAAEIREQNGFFAFDIFCRGKKAAHIDLSVPGRHNIYNALASFSVCDSLGLDRDKCAKALSTFTGAKRRMEKIGTLNGAPVYDDYAHHPTEITASLKSARALTKGRVYCVFQSHTYSRTHELFDGFASSLSLADRVVVADIYAARETNVSGVTPQRLAAAIGEKAVYGGPFEAIAKRVEEEISENDLLVIMGAGDICKIEDMMDIRK